MRTTDEVFAAFGGPASLGRAIGIEPFHAQTMKTRRSIPVRYWPRVVEAAQERGVEGISYETLVAVHAPEQERVAS